MLVDSLLASDLRTPFLRHMTTYLRSSGATITAAQAEKVCSTPAERRNENNAELENTSMARDGDAGRHA